MYYYYEINEHDVKVEVTKNDFGWAEYEIINISPKPSREAESEIEEEVDKRIHQEVLS